MDAQNSSFEKILAELNEADLNVQATEVVQNLKDNVDVEQEQSFSSIQDDKATDLSPKRFAQALRPQTLNLSTPTGPPAASSSVSSQMSQNASLKRQLNDSIPKKSSTANKR